MGETDPLQGRRNLPHRPRAIQQKSASADPRWKRAAGFRP
jgi:hypothetical protein